MRRYAAVAQLDRVTGYEPVGRGFESLQPYQKESSERMAPFCHLSLKGEGWMWKQGRDMGQRYVFYFRSSCGIADDNCLTTAGKLSIVVSGSGLYDGI